MALPRLRADLRDTRIVARVLRGALRHEVAVVPLQEMPQTSGQHLLEIEVPGEGLVTLLADPVGAASGDGVPLHVRPVTRPQMASLFALVEKLDDEPSKTVPPPSLSFPPRADEGYGDATLVDPPASAGVDVLFSEPPAFGYLDSSPPLPLPTSGERPPSTPPLPARPSGPPSSGDAFIGRVLAGKYRIDAPIGAGSTAAVYRAQHLDLKRAVAVKVLHAQNRGEMQFVKRFKAEALAASKLEHPNVARVIDFGQEPDGLLYIIMELLQGKSLEAILAVERRLPPRTALTIGIQVCSALASAHDAGIIHRDVKPENIMLVPGRDDDGNPCDRVKVCDFGMAKLREPDSESVAELTTAGMLCGSPAYMSPEQARGDPLDIRTDVYALGVTLYETLTGELPHEGDTLTQLLVRKLTERARRPTAFVRDLDPVLEDVILRALATDPAARHANARILREELRAALTLLEQDNERPEGTIIAD
jgi:serine/threonine-protein kinase